MNNSGNISGFFQTDFGLQILNQSTDKILVLGKNYTLKYFNPSAENHAFLFGLKKLELETEMLPKADTCFWKNSFDRALRGEKLEFKKTYLVGDKRYIDLVNIYPISQKNDPTPLIAFQAKNFDILPIDVKNILESEPLFQNLFETCPVGITIRKFDTQELKGFNLKICEMFDCTPEQFHSFNRPDFVHYEDKIEMEKKSKLLKERKIKSYRLEKQYKKYSTGDFFWGVATRSLFQIGNETYQMGILEDISTQKNFENRLIRNEAKVKAIFNSTKDKIFAVDKNFKLIEANESALKILGDFNLNEKKEKYSLEDFDFSNNDIWKPHFLKAFSGEEFTFEGNYFYEGEEQTDLIALSPLKNGLGEIIGASVYGKEITEIKKIQKALSESEAKLLEAQRLAKLGYWEIGKDNRKVIWSEGSPRIFGLSHKKTILDLEEYYQLVHPDDRQMIKDALEFSFNNGTPYELKTRKISKDGKIIYTIGRGEPLFEDGKVVKIFGTLQDVTKEREIENALIKNEAKVRAIFNSTNDKIYAIDTNYKLIDFNQSAAEILPPVFELDQLEIGTEMLAKTPALRQLWMGHYEEALNGKTIQLEKKYTINGKSKVDLVTVSPIQNNTGKIIGASVYGKEITNIKEIQKALAENETRLKEAQRLAKVGYWELDVASKMMKWSEGSHRVYGFPVKEGPISLDYYYSMTHPEDRPIFKNALEKSFKDGSSFELECRKILRNGDLLYTIGKCETFMENGKVTKVFGTIQDISQLKKAEEKREELLSELAIVNKELKDFAHIVSHDLKAPLRAINTISHWLSEDYADKLDKKGLHQLQLLSNRVNRMHQFINGIFEYTKMGRTKETKVIVDLNEVIQDVSMMLSLPENVDLKIVKKLPDLYCEKIKIEQVFQNLISNAIKYNDKEICKIDIDFEDGGTYYLFKVKDNGKGIEKKNFKKIFQIFQTLQPKDDLESTGIGLTIVKKIIQLHGGEISVQSELGKYTTFIFSIEK